MFESDFNVDLIIKNGLITITDTSQHEDWCNWVYQTLNKIQLLKMIEEGKIKVNSCVLHKGSEIGWSG